MKNIYDFNEINIMMENGCTRRDAEEHLKKGVTIYSPEDYLSMLREFPEVAEEMGISEIDQILKKCESGERIGDTIFTEYRKIPCIIEYVL